MFEGIGGDNKFFENYIDFIDQNFIGKEEVREMLKRIQLEANVNICQCGEKWRDSDLAILLKELLELLK